MRSLALIVSFVLGFAAVALCAALLVRIGAPGPAYARQAANGPTANGEAAPAMVTVRVFNKAGELVGPVATPRVVKTDAEWKATLTPEQFRIARGAGTERPFCGTLLDNHKDGVYACVCCGLPLFSSDAKFNSGTGWPSFFQPIARENVAEKPDDAYGMVRTEINCARCDAHLGHVFDDGPRPTGLRFCLNSESLAFTESKDLATLADPATRSAGGAAPGAPADGAPSASTSGAPGTPGERAEAVFAGGCFWCVEAVFEELDGVIEAVSGFAGGGTQKATYEEVCSGRLGHAEAVKIVYDPATIDYETLLRVHFATHDPTTLNRQGNDIGPQYRSVVFYATNEEKQTAERVIAELTASGVYKRPIVTAVQPLDAFFEAEPYHQNYVCNNPQAGYVQGVSMPKVEKVRAKFKDRLKAKSPLER